ncbi:MAG: hypothetical protein R3C51_13260 [Parvularculaceae bacterium]
MRRSNRRGPGFRPHLAALVGACAIWFSPAASAATATFVSSTPPGANDLTTLSTAGDNDGPLVTLGEWIGLIFSQPFGVSKTDSVSIFTLAPPTGKARLTISFGVWNGGSPIYVNSKSVNAGGSLSTGNLFQKGCSAFGGCDFIQITTTRQTKGATGAQVDYVDVNGQVTTVTAPTPEPAVWLLMIMGFWAVAARLKALRRRRVSAAYLGFGASPSSA